MALGKVLEKVLDFLDTLRKSSKRDTMLHNKLQATVDQVLFLESYLYSAEVNNAWQKEDA